MKKVDLDEDHEPDDILMAWVKRQIHRYVLPLYNFKSCWVDGKIFVAILLNNGLLKKEQSWEKLCDLTAEQRIQLGKDYLITQIAQLRIWKNLKVQF